MIHDLTWQVFSHSGLFVCAVKEYLVNCSYCYYETNVYFRCLGGFIDSFVLERAHNDIRLKFAVIYTPNCTTPNFHL
jgi:hypothetical protein